MRRRLLLTAAGLLPAAALAGEGVPPPLLQPNPDAELIGLCAAFHEANQASYNAPEDTNEWEVHLHRRWGISDQLEGMEPVTRAGLIAKLRVGLVLLEEQTSGSKHENFALAAMEAIVRGAPA